MGESRGVKYIENLGLKRNGTVRSLQYFKHYNMIEVEVTIAFCHERVAIAPDRKQYV